MKNCNGTNRCTRPWIGSQSKSAHTDQRTTEKRKIRVPCGCLYHDTTSSLSPSVRVACLNATLSLVVVISAHWRHSVPTLPFRRRASFPVIGHVTRRHQPAMFFISYKPRHTRAVKRRWFELNKELTSTHIDRWWWRCACGLFNIVASCKNER
jgi:hypothetical protein